MCGTWQNICFKLGKLACNQPRSAFSKTPENDSNEVHFNPTFLELHTVQKTAIKELVLGFHYWEAARVSFI